MGEAAPECQGATSMGYECSSPAAGSLGICHVAGSGGVPAVWRRQEAPGLKGLSSGCYVRGVSTAATASCGYTKQMSHLVKALATMSLPPWMRYALYGNAAIDVVVFLVPKNISLMVDEKFESCQGPPREMKA